MEESETNIEYLWRSKDIAKLAKALAQAQLEIKPPRKNKQNGAFGSPYADLQSVIEAVTGPLAKHGLSYTQLVHETRLKTVLMHDSGQWVSSIYPLNPAKETPHGVGSALTYARRYSLSAITGVASEDDDDGNLASDVGEQPKGKKPYEHSGVVYTGTPDQKKVLSKIFARLGVDKKNDRVTISDALISWKTSAHASSLELSAKKALDELRKTGELTEIPF